MPEYKSAVIGFARTALVCASGSLLVACALAKEPYVNRMGVDDARYNRDVATCKQQAGPLPGFSNPVATCLSGKGYQVLVGK